MEAFEYAKLADISSRSACPRCDGFGFIHSSVDRHDKPPNQRCKKCVDCEVCETSGITVGVVKCFRCTAKGFYHSPNAPSPHQFGEFVKCFDCLDCKDCLGVGVLDQKRIQALKEVQKNAKSNQLKLAAGLTPERNVYPPLIPEGAPFSKLYPTPVLADIDPGLMHSHIMGILGIPITADIINIMKNVPMPKATLSRNAKSKSALVQQVKKKSKCPRCEGKGFKHLSSAKHEPKKGSDRCKRCASCKACSGTGSVIGKVACSVCETRGFVHLSSEREHDVSLDMRCFFCKDCINCKGSGVQDAAQGLELEAKSDVIRNSFLPLKHKQI